MLDLAEVNARLRAYHARDGYASWPEALEDMAGTYALLGLAVDELAQHRARYDQLFAERARDLDAHKRLLGKVDAQRLALDAERIASNRMRAALGEAAEELGRGQILHAQAAIRRGLVE